MTWSKRRKSAGGETHGSADVQGTGAEPNGKRANGAAAAGQAAGTGKQTADAGSSWSEGQQGDDGPRTGERPGAEKGPGAGDGSRTAGESRTGGESGDGSGPRDGGGPGAESESSGPAGIQLGAADACGRHIKEVFFKRELYAIYLVEEGVNIQFAKDNAEASKQIDRVSALLLLRDEIEDLARQLKAPRTYDRQIAGAMRMGLEGKPEIGESLLDAARSRANAELARRGRMQYLQSAVTLAISVAVVLLVVGTGLLSASVAPVAPLTFAMAGGALGALLSIAIAIQKRTVATAGDPKTNRIDGQLRVVIAVLSAGTLGLLASTGIVDGLGVDTDTDQTLTGMTWDVAILLGIAAGFVERLVPDLLDKASVTSTAGSGSKNL